MTQMTEFLSCKPEAEYSATGSEREEKGVGGKESEKKNVGIPINGLSPGCPLSTTPAQGKRPVTKWIWHHCSEVRGRNKSREVRFSQVFLISYH